MPKIKGDNISICYETQGDPTKPCVILIMGITGQLISWPSELTQGLADSGFYVVTFDNRDVGLSSYYDHLDTPALKEALAKKEKGEPFNPPYSLHDMAEDIITLMNGLKIDKAHIVGISMGGHIAQVFALEHPGRVFSLSLIATSSGDPGLPPPRPDLLNFFFNLEVHNPDLESCINQHIQQNKQYHHPDDVDEEATRELFEKLYNRAHHPEGHQRQLLAILFAEARGERLKSLNIPSLVIHGDADPLVPLPHGYQLAECLPNVQLEVIENMGHGIPSRIYLKLVAMLSEHFKKD